MLLGMVDILWPGCVRLLLPSAMWPFFSMASKHSVLGFCQIGGSLDQRHLTRCCTRQLRTPGRSIGVGLYFCDISCVLRRWCPYQVVHGKDVQHEGESETLLAHISTSTPRWHEYGCMVFLHDYQYLLCTPPSTTLLSIKYHSSGSRSRYFILPLRVALSHLAPLSCVSLIRSNTSQMRAGFYPYPSAWP